MSATTVCVTGAAGYVGSHVVAELLRKGFIVRATVRDLADSKKYGFLNKIAEELGATSKLSFHEADLLKPSSFDAAVQGCDAVIHTASPFIIGKVFALHMTLF